MLFFCGRDSISGANFCGRDSISGANFCGRDSISGGDFCASICGRSMLVILFCYCYFLHFVIFFKGKCCPFFF